MEISIGICILVLTLMLGVPIPFCFGASVIYLTYALDLMPGFLLPIGYSKLGSVVLLAIPLFIMAGGIIEKSKMGAAITDLVEKFVGGIKGGLGVVSILSSAIFGSISGSAAATLSCIGTIMIPKLEKSGYPKGISAALIANASPLGLLIPPSSAQILFAWAGNQSVLACFLATIVPGLILTFLLCVVNVVLLRSHKLSEGKKVDAPVGHYDDLFITTKKATPALLMPVIILGGIYAGIMTPTESAAIAVLYSIPIGLFVYKGLTVKGLKDTLIETGTTTGVVMVMFFVVMMLSRILIMEDFPDMIMNLLTSISDNRIIILLMINLFMIIIGMLMDDVSGILLCTPILLPVAQELGIHPVQFAAIIGVNLGMGNITPPTAPLLYLGARVGKAPVNEMMKPTLAMILFAWFPTLILTTYCPAIALTLPQLILGGKL